MFENEITRSDLKEEPVFTPPDFSQTSYSSLGALTANTLDLGTARGHT